MLRNAHSPAQVKAAEAHVQTIKQNQQEKKSSLALMTVLLLVVCGDGGESKNNRALKWRNN
jgi:hypothetical protein